MLSVCAEFRFPLTYPLILLHKWKGAPPFPRFALPRNPSHTQMAQIQNGREKLPKAADVLQDQDQDQEDQVIFMLSKLSGFDSTADFISHSCGRVFFGRYTVTLLANRLQNILISMPFNGLSIGMLIHV